MRAAVYERRGPAREVLKIVDRPMPEPAHGEVRVRVAVSALNPTDIKARSQWLGQTTMPAPLITPHRDGAGIIDKVGDGVDPPASANACGSGCLRVNGHSVQQPTTSLCHRIWPGHCRKAPPLPRARVCPFRP